MKNFSKIALLLLIILTFRSFAFAYEWKASILPASLNADNTLSLASGEVQAFNFALQADADVTSKNTTHQIELEWDMPANMSILQAEGLYKFSAPQSTVQNGRNVTAYNVQVSNTSMLGAPDARLDSEWKLQTLFVNAPSYIANGQDYLRVTLRDGDYKSTFNWPIKIQKIKPAAQYPKRTVLGLWDYDLYYANQPATAAGIAQLLKNSGVNFTEIAVDPIYRKALQAKGIVAGGNVHQSLFRSDAYPDYDAAGKILNSGMAYADPQAVIALPAGAEIPGVKQLIAAAKANDGIATFDYEPNGLEGFSPQSTQLFKTRYNINDADFERFRDYVAKNGMQTSFTNDPNIAEIWRKWVEFRSDQTSNYIRRITEAVKAQAPDVRIAVTTNRSAGSNSAGALALGTNYAPMARFTDIIIPQIYSGYGGANAKLAMQLVANWRHELQQQKAKAQLWPLLLVRYAGATVYNSPQRLRQQIIGSLAQGANGVGLYYPGNMDATYWEMLARTTEDIAKYEDFYQDGTRADEQFPLSLLPMDTAKVTLYPGYEETVQNPGWAFTAHRLKDRVLLTLINLEDAKDITFGIDTGAAKVLSTQDATEAGTDRWRIAPGKIGFILLEAQ